MFPCSWRHVSKSSSLTLVCNKDLRQVAWEFPAEFKCILGPKQDVIAFREGQKKWNTAFGKKIRDYYHQNSSNLSRSKIRNTIVVQDYAKLRNKNSLFENIGYNYKLARFSSKTAFTFYRMTNSHEMEDV